MKADKIPKEELDEMGIFVVKAQMPLGGHMGDLLVYNEDRSINVLFPITKEIRKMMGKSIKKFLYAQIRTKTLCLGNDAPSEDW